MSSDIGPWFLAYPDTPDHIAPSKACALRNKGRLLSGGRRLYHRLRRARIIQP
jgi:hypothetical protein